jgi:hypothetical protein
MRCKTIAAVNGGSQRWSFRLEDASLRSLSLYVRADEVLEWIRSVSRGRFSDCQSGFTGERYTELSPQKFLAGMSHNEESDLKLSPAADQAMAKLVELFSDPSISLKAQFRCSVEGPTEVETVGHTPL